MSKPIPKCDPNVYREAARIVASKSFSQHRHCFSCIAISDVIASRLTRWSSKFLVERDWYTSQFKAFCAPAHRDLMFVDNEGRIDEVRWSQIYDMPEGPRKTALKRQKFAVERQLDRHPFWNRASGFEAHWNRQQHLRVMALLMMAEFCERP